MSDEKRREELKIVADGVIELSLDEMESISGGVLCHKYDKYIGDDCIILDGIAKNDKHMRIYFPIKQYGSEERAVEAALKFAEDTGISTEWVEDL